MKRLALCLAALVVPAIVSAQETDVNANFNIAVTQPSYGGCADPVFDFVDEATCSDLDLGPVAGPAFVWVITSREGGYPLGVGGAQFGLEHDLSGGWSLCTGGSEIPEDGWPASGTGNAVTWGGGCYEPVGGNAKIGFVAVNDGDMGSIQVTADPRIGQSLYADCDAVLHDVCAENLGGGPLADLAVICGDNCAGVPTESKSWSEIKSLY